MDATTATVGSADPWIPTITSLQLQVHTAARISQLDPHLSLHIAKRALDIINSINQPAVPTKTQDEFSLGSAYNSVSLTALDRILTDALPVITANTGYRYDHPDLEQLKNWRSSHLSLWNTLVLLYQPPFSDVDDWEREAQVTAILDQQTLIDNLLATATTAISEAEDPSPFLAEARQVAVTGAFYSASWELRSLYIDALIYFRHNEATEDQEGADTYWVGFLQLLEDLLKTETPDGLDRLSTHRATLSSWFNSQGDAETTAYACIPGMFPQEISQDMRELRKLRTWIFDRGPDNHQGEYSPIVGEAVWDDDTDPRPPSPGFIFNDPPGGDEAHESGPVADEVFKPEGKIMKDTFLGSCRVFLMKASGIADVIPDPFGKILKSIADTGVEIMDVLDDVDSNHDDARNLGAHINSLAQAIVQFLSSDSASGAGPDEQLETTLQSFSRTLVEVFNGLQSLRSQGKFTNIALRKQNRADLQGYDQTIQRAFERLQACVTSRWYNDPPLIGALFKVGLQLYALRSLSDQERERLFDRLGAADNGAKDKAPTPEELLCLPGTRELILSRIRTWIETPSSSRMMWLNGVAGCGKSTIAATVFHHQQQLSRTAAIFYCTANDQPRCDTIVSTLAYWLADASHGSLENPIRKAVIKHPKVSTLQLSEQVELLLAAPLATIANGAPPTVIVIDGLDEWYDVAKASALVSSLFKMVSRTKRNIKILITSRDESHIRDAFLSDDDPDEDTIDTNPPSVWRFPLDEEDLDAVEVDIRVYLEHNLREIRRKTKMKKNWPSPAQLDALVRKSDHLFQFAATTIRYIRLGYPPDALDAILSNTQTSNLKELDRLYMVILRTVFDTCLNDVTAPIFQHVLQCLVCSAVPIGLDVIAYLWSNEPNTDSDYIRIRQSALNHLGSFLVAPDDPRQSVRFLHISAVEFLTDSTRCTDSRFFVDTTQGHAYLSALCLRRLNRDLRQNICSLEDFRLNVDDPEPDAGFSEVIAAAIHPGLQYASLYWSFHLHAAPTSLTSVKPLSLVSDFASQHILHWIEVLALLRSVSSVGHPSTRKAADWCSRVPSAELSQSSSLFSDTTRFLGLFAGIISSHPLLIYEYILSFVPTESMLRKSYEPRRHLRVDVVRGPMQTRWPAHQWTVNHSQLVLCTALSPDGATIVSGGEDGTIKLWDATSGIMIGESLAGHTRPVLSVAFSRDEKLIVSSSEDSTVRVWEIETGRARGDPLTGHTNGVQSVTLSPDGTVVASGSDDGTVRFWRLEDGRQVGEPLRLEAGGVKSVAFTPDGLAVICGCGDGSVQRWNMKTREAAGEIMTGHTETVWSVCVSPNGRLIASGSKDKYIRLWSPETGEQVGTPLEGHSGDVYSVGFSPDGTTIVSGSKDSTVRIWDTMTGKQRGKALTGHAYHVNAVAFMPDGMTVMSGSIDGIIRTWDVNRVEDEGEQVEGHSASLRWVAFTSDARFVATGSLEGSMMVWSTEKGTLLGKVERGYGQGRLRFSLGGTELRENGQTQWDSWDGFVREWDVSGAVVKGTDAAIRQVEPDEDLEFPDLEVEELMIDSEGWISRGGSKWLWVPEVYGWDYRCHLLGTKLVLQTRPVPIIDVAGLL